MKMYRIASVRREREEGKEPVLLASLVDEEGAVVLNGTLAHVVRLCEERGYNVANIEQAKTVLGREPK